VHVAHLQVAPVKGLAVVPRSEVVIAPHGVAGDRALFLLTGEGSVVTLRRFPQLSALVPSVDEAAGTLAVRFPDGRVVSQPLPLTGEPVAALLFGRERRGLAGGGPVADAIAAVAGVRLRLVVIDPGGHGWDEGPVSLLSTATVRAVRGGSADSARFRMTVTVEGAVAFEEEAWLGTEIRIGDAVLGDVRPLSRCVVIERSAATGQHDWRGLRQLMDVRPDGRPTLGVVASVVRSGVVRVGDPVRW
jgi:uncharacterized protein YcbX